MDGGRIVSCAGCGQKNRVRTAAAGAPHCSSCGRALPWVADVGGADFRTAVLESPLPVLIDFWAPWCGPCRTVGPAVEHLGSELAGRLKVAKVDTDREPELSARHGVRGIPTLVLVHHGREVDRLTGALPRPALRTWVESRLEAVAAGQR